MVQNIICLQCLVGAILGGCCVLFCDDGLVTHACCTLAKAWLYELLLF